ncbi:response regulator [Candidatus Microgenomates bacterium]|nr:response regulator [Candidatus Microgenomates bacterium]
MRVPVIQTILLVEDDPDLAELYQLQLQRAGYKVRLAETAQAALRQLERRPPQAIILDMLLPEYNGLGILHEMRSYDDWRTIPVVILSNIPARELGVTEYTLQQLGIARYLEKAHTSGSQLVATLKAVLTPKPIRS